MNLLLLEAGDTHLSDSDYPDFLTEVGGVPLLQRVLDKARTLPLVSLSIAFRTSDIASANVDRVAKLLFAEANVIRVHGPTGGAACTALLAARFIDSDLPLLILSGNEFVDVDYGDVLAQFETRGLDGGVLTFESVHPRYSFVKLDESDLVVEAAEKRPISHYATAGFYYFARGRDFVTAAKSMIRKDARTHGHFYVCPAYNELILAGARIGAVQIPADRYLPLKSEEQLSRSQLGTSQ